ncbi:MAG: class I SAM-dependent methyltransferase [Phycisphaerae bacterium]|nr:class I SAM-dependent methyltransferase [Phycisphaerae bacterium]
MSKRDGKLWKAHAQAEFERWAETYDQSVLQRLLFQRCYLKFIELILDGGSANGNGELRLLDIGCGTGTFISMLAETSLPVRAYGLDMAVRMCQIGAEKTRRLGIDDRIGFIVADSEHLPLEEGAFDVVTCSNSFHHYPHQSVVVAQMYRALRPGGRLIILDGFRDNVIGWFIFDVCVAMVEKSVHHCTASEMCDLLETAGFERIVQQKFGFWAPVLATVGIKPGGDST